MHKYFDLGKDNWGEVDKNLDEAGNIINPAFETKLSSFVDGYLTFVGKMG